jgi:hypothetical protein
MEAESVRNKRKMGSPLSGWMKQHVRLVEASMSMAEVENVLLETDGTLVFSLLRSDNSHKSELLELNVKSALVLSLFVLQWVAFQ